MGRLKKMSNCHHKKWSWSLKTILRGSAVVTYFWKTWAHYKSQILICWVVICPLDSAVHRLKQLGSVSYFNHLVCSFVASCHQVSIWGQSLYNKWHCAGLSKYCAVFVPDNLRGTSKNPKCSSQKYSACRIPTYNHTTNFCSWCRNDNDCITFCHSNSTICDQHP